jgi:hypothetical protein
MNKMSVLWLIPFVVLPASAQQSASYRLTEHTLNAGGNPNGAASLVSASYHVKLDAIGAGVAQTGLASPSFRSDASFVACYPPPGEVGSLRFTATTDLAWSSEQSVGDYNLYRDALATLAARTYGTCLQYDVANETATDGVAPSPGQGFFYLVTAENRLEEEGTKGVDSAGAARGNPNACP